MVASSERSTHRESPRLDTTKWDGVTSAKMPVLPLAFYMTMDRVLYHFLFGQFRIKINATPLQKSAQLLGRGRLAIQ